MAIDQGPMSGFRDMLPEQMLPREDVLTTIKDIYELYGFTPLKTPALERFETMNGKYGEEGNKLMYQFHDNGDRHVALRYDHTVPLARVVAQHGSKLPSPYKRYVVGDVWRGESPQAGRYREFGQFDADIVGTHSYLADTEVIAMMSDSMEAIGVSATIRVNDRRLLDGLAVACGIEGQSGFMQLVTSIDKVEKIGKDGVLDEVHESFGDLARSTVDAYLSVEGDDHQKLGRITELLQASSAHEGVDNLRKILGALSFAGYGAEIVFDQTIARGLNYYTSTVYETSLNDLPGIGSVCSGGRYDNLIESMGGPDTPAVGTSIGVDRLMEGLRQLGLLKPMRTRTRAYITNLDAAMDNQRFALAQQLRKQGVPTEISYDARKLGKQIASIEKLGVGEVVIYGQKEADQGIVLVKDLSNGEQREVALESLGEEFKD
ncbi:MAG: Histidyl-tRNA synthetase [Candidatus Saccharibacteria bacterium]|nr:Histidyl-tRNA synthetase [Candidatus Saccharibacteria bacterium]